MPWMDAADSRAMRVWGHVWRVGLALLAGWLLIVVFLGPAAMVHYLPGDVWPKVDLLLTLLTSLALILRHRWPFAVAMGVALIAMVAIGPFAAGAVALVSLATHRNWRTWVPVSLVLALGTLVFARLHPLTVPDDQGVANFITSVVFVGLCVVTGLFIGARRELLERLRSELSAAQSEQTLRVAQAQVAERARIAREMHDVLAHRISVVAMHSGALGFRDDLTPEQVTATAAIINDNASAALVELRQVLGVLREQPAGDVGAESAPRVDAPQPTLADLAELVAQQRAHGMSIELAVEEAAMDTPVAVSRNAFRIVQEGLTNAAKHAPGRPVWVTVERLDGAGDGRLSLEVRNRLGVSAGLPGGGLGLIGVTERAVLLGGELRHGVDGKDFVLSAWLPLDRDDD